MNSQDFINTELNRTRKMFPVIKKIFIKNAHQFINFNEATKGEDLTQGFDCIINLESIKIALRIRHYTCKYRDFTIRWKNPNSIYQCEYEKIMEGKGDLYFYAWTNENDNINEYMIINLDLLRKSGIMNNEKPIKKNEDNTCFKVISIQELLKEKCIKIYESL